MYFASFATETPLDHVPRALDELARAGLGFGRLEVTGNGAASQVRIGFFAGGTISPETYLERLRRMPGVSVLTGGADAQGEAGLADRGALT